MYVKCPCCNIPLEVLDSTDIDVEEDIYLYSVGKCTQCNKVYTYTEVFTYTGYENLTEIGGNQNREDIEDDDE